jgi:hypothetical protein
LEKAMQATVEIKNIQLNALSKLTQFNSKLTFSSTSMEKIMLTDQSLSFRIPLTADDRAIAIEFAKEQQEQGLDKAKQVYLNSLAVCATRHLLDWMSFEVDLEQSDSWHPFMRRVQNVADIIIPELGSLECCPILPDQDSFVISEEVLENRLAYLAIEIQSNFEEALFLGFKKCSDLLSSTQEISDLSPAEELLNYLMILESGRKFLDSQDPDAVQVRKLLGEHELPEIYVIASLEALYQNSSGEISTRSTSRQVAQNLVGNIPIRAFGETREMAATRGASEASTTDSGTVQLAGRFFQKLVSCWQVQPEPDPSIAEIAAVAVGQRLKETVINLGQWLERNFSKALELGWQSGPIPVLAVGYRSLESAPIPEVSDFRAIITTLSRSTSDHEQRVAALALRGITLTESEKTEAIETLIGVLTATQNEETRWTIADSLYELDPLNTASCQIGSKRVDLGVELERHSLNWEVAVLPPQPNGRVHVRVKVSPQQAGVILPEHLKLEVLEGDVAFATVEARQADWLLQYKFYGNSGERFRLRLTRGNTNVVEDFQI